jgi:hypothetical protein
MKQLSLQKMCSKIRLIFYWISLENAIEPRMNTDFHRWSTSYVNSIDHPFGCKPTSRNTMFYLCKSVTD